MAATPKPSESIRLSLEQRRGEDARTTWPQLRRLHVRHRGAFAYVEGLVDELVVRVASTRRRCRVHDVSGEFAGADEAGGKWLAVVAVLLEQGPGVLDEGTHLVLADVEEVGDQDLSHWRHRRSGHTHHRATDRP
jgi:hypothetical protein